VICKWDPYNAVISEAKGKFVFENIMEGITFREEVDEQTGFTEKVITESKRQKENPAIHIIDAKRKKFREYNLPVDAHINVKEGDKIDCWYKFL